MSGQVWPLSVEFHVHDMLRVKVGELRSGASTSCQFSLCAVANRLPSWSATKLGSYPKPSVGVTLATGPKDVFCARQNVAVTNRRSKQMAWQKRWEVACIWFLSWRV